MARQFSVLKIKVEANRDKSDYTVDKMRNTSQSYKASPPYEITPQCYLPPDTDKRAPP